MPPTYQLTQEQMNDYTALQEERQRKKRNWLDRLLGRKAEAAQQQSKHTYAGPYKPYDPLRFIRPYHPDDLDIETLDWLADSYTVRPALMFIVTTILAAIKNATIECKDPDIVAFIKELVHPKLLDLWEKSAKALKHGVSFNEVIRSNEDVEVEREDKETGETTMAYKGYALIPDEVRHNVIETITDVWKDENGKLAGYTQDRETHVGLAQPDSTSWCFVYSVNDEENPVWGKPEIRFVYSLAYWTDVFISLAMRRGEKEASGALVGHAPKGKTDVEGEMVDNLEHMANILSQLQDHLVTVFPWEVDPTTKEQMWGFMEVALSERSDIAKAMLEYLAKWIFLTLLVPPDVLEVATKPFGSRSAVETLWDAFLVRMQGLGDRWADKVEERLLMPLVREHFGQQAPKVNLILVLSQAQKEVIKEAFTVILTNHPDVPRLDLPQMAEDLGIPVKKEEEMPAPVPEQPAPPKPGEEEKPPAPGEEEAPTPALTLELGEGMRWDEVVEQARLLLDVGVPAETSVRVKAA